MKILPFVAIDDAALASSNVPESDYDIWRTATVYNVGSRVIVQSTHGIYESVSPKNAGNDPTKDDGTHWVYVSKTNRWRAFDGRNSAKARQSGTIFYELIASRTANTVALMGVEAVSVRVQVLDADGVSVYDVTREIVDTSTVGSYFEYFTFVPPDTSDSHLFANVTILPSYRIRITLDGVSGTAGVSVIGYGLNKIEMRTLAGTTPGIADYSTKERDDFGEVQIIERDFARTITFNVAFPTADVAKIMRTFESLRATPALYYESDTLPNDLIVLGFYSDWAPAITQTYTLASVEIIGVLN